MKGPGAFRDLSRDERMLLMRFVCSFAWADFQVRPEERELVARLVQQLDLAAAEIRQVADWLETPSNPDDLDPGQVPSAHRRAFLNALEAMVTADGHVAPAEREALLRFAKLAR